MFGKKKQDQAEAAPAAPAAPARQTVTVTGTDGRLTNYHDVTPEQAERLRQWERDQQSPARFRSRMSR